jgi:hypothetical protein
VSTCLSSLFIISSSRNLKLRWEYSFLFLLVIWHLYLLVKMTNLNTIRVIPFCGKVDEWLIWSEKFLAKAKRYGFKDVLLRKLSIPKADEEFDEILD